MKKYNVNIQIFNEKLILALIAVNVLVIYLHSFESLNYYYKLFDVLDTLFTLFFIVEIVLKINSIEGTDKFKKYFKNPWNKIDFFSILLSLPSIGVLFIADLEIFAGFTVLRSFRIIKLLRIIEFIPQGKRISKQLFRALKSVYFIIYAFFAYTTIISLISVSLFRHSAPDYFQNAFESFFTTFKIFSGDGFSDIVLEIKSNSSPLFTSFSKFYFVSVVFSGSILGLSLINSIFFDQMNQNSSLAEKERENQTQKLIHEIDFIKKQQEKILAVLESK